MSVITSIADLRALARRRIPRAVFDYADGGAYGEITLHRNCADLDAIQLRQRVMVDVSSVSTAATILGQAAAMPVAIAPTGLAGLFHADGEILGALAAERFGIPFCLSTMSICSIEEVRQMTTVPFWFQQYLMRDRGFNQALIDRAAAAQCAALVLTLDLPVQGDRHRDAKNGLTIPPRLNWRNAFDIASRPGWIWNVLLGGRRSFGNLEGHIGGTGGLRTLAEWAGKQFDPSANWRDVEWVRSRWPGKLVIKGIMDSDDARQAVQCGADAIVVSNHGGRQLDGAPSSISMLPEIAAATGRCEVLFDGGVRSGHDVLRARALGANGVLIGKAFLYALAAAGQAGVMQALQIIQRELRVSLALVGKTNMSQVDGTILVQRAEPTGR